MLILSIIGLSLVLVNFILLAHSVSRGEFIGEEAIFISNVIPLLLVPAIFIESLRLKVVVGIKEFSMRIILVGLVVNLVTLIMFYAWLYLDIFARNHSGFSTSLGWMDAILISLGISTTIGYTEIFPRSLGAKIAVASQEVVSFVIVIFVISWVISLFIEHSKRRVKKK